MKKFVLLVFVLLLITSFILTNTPLVQTDPTSSIVKLWSFEAGDEVSSVCSIPDVNGDGIYDVVAGTRNSTSPVNNVYCLNGLSGEVIWTYSAGQKVAVLPSHETEDAFNVVAADGEGVYLLRGNNGSEIWSFSEGGVVCPSTGILVPDVDNDGIPEIVAREFNNICLLSGASGQVLWNVSSSQMVYSVELSAAHVSNLNRKSNVVIGIPDKALTHSYIVSFNSTNGEKLWNQSIYNRESYPIIVSAPLRENGSVDVIVGAVNGCYLLNGVDGKVIWSRHISYSHHRGSAVYDLAVISDIDDDSVDDVIEGGGDRKVRVLSGADGTIIWEHASSYPSPRKVMPIQDLNEDGVSDMAVGTFSPSHVYFLNGINGRLLGTHPLPYEDVLNMVWDLATIPDVNDDGLDEVIVGSKNNGVFLLSAAFEADTTKPISYDDYNELWYNTEFTINLTATDFHSDVDEMYYRINDGPIRSVSVDGHPLITTEGANNRLEYWSVDNAENEEDHHILTDIKLDKTQPTVSAGQNQKVKVNSTITFDASDSTDNLSGISSYEWDFGDGQSATEVMVNHTYSNLGKYTASLTVGDVAGNNATDSIVITVTGEDFSLLILGTVIGTAVIAMVLGTLFFRKRRTVKE